MSEIETKPEKKKRARKTSPVPTRIYSYRCLPPITEIERVEDQYRLAARYRNTHVEIEHALRDKIREIQLEHASIGPCLRLVEDAQGAVDAAYDDLRAAKSGVAEPDLEEPLEILARAKELRSYAFGDLREAKRAFGNDPLLLAAYAAAREASHVQRTAARKDYSARGLRHGAYVRVENAIQQAAASTKRPLRFESYDGSGSIGTQLLARDSSQSEEAVKIYGLTIPELLSTADTRLRLGPPGALDKHPREEVGACTTWDAAMQLGRNLRRHAARTWVDLRIGSNPDRSPIFARFPVTLHRLPPKDAVIKWAYIVRRRIGHRLEWRLQLTLESKIFERPPIAIGSGTCAVNLGWRRILDDRDQVVGLRAAYVVDDRGNEREIRVPDYIPSHGPVRSRPILDAVEKCDDLISIRDKSLDGAKQRLSAWIAEHGVPEAWMVVEPARPDGSPARSMADRLRGHAAWRAIWKLSRFLDAWKTRRVPGDDQIFTDLTAWAKQDRHLETWQASMRDRLIAHRREIWRVIATELARTYATIVVGESKLTDIDGWEQKDPEDGDPHEGRDQRRIARIVAPGELLAEIGKASHKTGAEVRRVNDVRATRACADCGYDEPWDAKPSIQHTCVGCGRTWDQDANHGRNLLARVNVPASGVVPPIRGEALVAASAKKKGGITSSQRTTAQTYASE